MLDTWYALTLQRPTSPGDGRPQARRSRRGHPPHGGGFSRRFAKRQISKRRIDENAEIFLGQQHPNPFGVAGLPESIRGGLLVSFGIGFRVLVRDCLAAVGGLAVVLSPVSAVANEPAGAGSACCRVEYQLAVDGELFASAGPDAAPLTQTISLTASFDFDELPAGPDKSAAVGRRYQKAAATLAIDGESHHRELAADAGSLFVAVEGTTPVPFLADGFLSRSEAELLDLPFDPVLLERLSPAEAVAAGATWTIDADLVAGLLAIDTVETGSLRATLEEVVGETAKVSLEGTVHGAVDGVATRIAVTGSFQAPVSPGEAADTWKVAAERARLEVSLAERRQAGWVAPGLDVEATIHISRTGESDLRPAETARLAPTRSERPAGPGRPGHVWHQHSHGRYSLAVDRRWRVVEDGPNGLVMRLVDRGMLVAQCSILPLPRGDADSPATVEQVQRDVERSLGSQFGRIAEAESLSRSDGTRVVRVVADGNGEGRPFRWIHHVLTDSQGYRAAVTCMLEPAMLERFAVADSELVAGLVLLPDRPREASRPVATPH
jgi:hypothetical protein